MNVHANITKQNIYVNCQGKVCPSFRQISITYLFYSCHFIPGRNLKNISAGGGKVLELPWSTTVCLNSSPVQLNKHVGSSVLPRGN